MTIARGPSNSRNLEKPAADADAKMSLALIEGIGFISVPGTEVYIESFSHPAAQNRVIPDACA